MLFWVRYGFNLIKWRIHYKLVIWHQHRAEQHIKTCIAVQHRLDQGWLRLGGEP